MTGGKGRGRADRLMLPTDGARQDINVSGAFTANASLRGATVMTDKPPGFFEGTEMPNAGWWERV
ncbi:MAG: hypothetical protein WA858_29380 [Xanthobacteraceae bacterium]|jgi:hypothetical protein